MYDFSKGPLVWIAFGIFLIGSIYRIVSVIKLAKKDNLVIILKVHKISEKHDIIYQQMSLNIS